MNSYVDVDTLGDLRPISSCVLSLGSNLGDRFELLSSAVEALRDTPDLIVVDVSPVYRTAPVGVGDEHGDFLNIVAIVETTMQPETLLDRVNAIEHAYGRVRWDPSAPRTLDIDLITMGQHRLETPRLTLPHPRAHLRGFVLVPWHDVEPDALLGDHGRIARLLDGLDVSDVTRTDLVLGK